MALLNLYSRRKRLAQKTGDDVYQYASISPKLRNQILFVFDEWDNKFESYDDAFPIYSVCTAAMRKELGMRELTTKYFQNDREEFHYWFLASASIDSILDGIEIAVRIGKYHAGKFSNYRDFYSAGLDEINARMLEDGFGFQVESGNIIEINSTFIHKNVTVPALSLLSSPDFNSADTEFRDAYREFNQKNYEDCIHDCCNAFESVLKVILTQKGWPFDPSKDTASKLLSIAFDNGLIPAYMQTEFTGLRTILESGVPTVRNKTAGHGAGANPRNIPKHVAAFQLHQTAAAIVLLVEASKP